MLLVDNINILKTRYTKTWDRIKNYEDKLDENYIKVEETKKGFKTLSVDKDGKIIYMHSKYNPIREAETIVDEYDGVEDGANVIFYGIGLGYHIDSFLEKYPNVNYYIYEPIPEILHAYLSNKSLKDLPSKNLMDIMVGLDEQEIATFLSRFIDKNRSDVQIVELPIHKQIFPDEYEKFLKLFKDMINDKRSGIHTDYAFQKRWIINSMRNFGDVISTPNIIMEKKDQFKGKPAILVAAGPSLNEEIENLKYIKENGLAYIFSVGSAINSLIHHEIYPDAATTYDPTVNNQKVFAKVKEKEIKDIPMIFGSSVGYETLIDYPGEKYHMITSQDTVANYFLKIEESDNIAIVLDAPSIAVVTLQLLYTLGFGPIILVGQNLAYRGKERHSEGVYYSSEVSEQEMENGIWVKDVYGNEVLTNEGFNNMRSQMELYIKGFPNINVINTTKGGAHIEGTSFMEFEEVMNSYLKEKVVEDNWLEGNKTNYDRDYVKSQTENMDRALKRAKKLIGEYHDILDKIERLINNRNFNEVEKKYTELDKVFGKLERNKFFITFILPMNRVQYKILANSIDNLNAEKNSTVKGRRIVDSFRGFIELCNRDINMIEPIYEEMKDEIKSFIV
ncbi:motility associated factor glycosyltransferase family protein [Anaerosalibacter sp. Marseille-P3206]|uniref:motility associated factor glycosyltransferase family protein n=1 Tax=Anaerosalibacter sp. Marseille-P3206 TaxID=1871005 RepID=UPI000987A298|nr:6-hydroxymethylpterin diphosphokinase MptE-like protein [Anaerosalibacter sp. Marseille-P3206]